MDVRLLKDCIEEDSIHLAPSDKFSVWITRGPNYQNDWIRAKSIDDFEGDECYGEMAKNQACNEICEVTIGDLHKYCNDRQTIIVWTCIASENAGLHTSYYRHRNRLTRLHT